MKPEEQRIAIAEACGWTANTPDAKPYLRQWLSPSKMDSNLYVMPDYLRSLDAMHEAEKVLSATHLKKYHGVLVADVIGWDACGNEHIAIHASAAQRAEAFLRTLNLWKDDT